MCHSTPGTPELCCGCRVCMRLVAVVRIRPALSDIGKRMFLEEKMTA